MRHQGNEALSGCAPHFDPPPLGGMEDNLAQNLAFSSKIFLSESTEVDMVVSGACLDVKLCSAWPLAHSEGGLRGVPLFWKKTSRRLLLPNYPSDSIHI